MTHLVLIDPVSDRIVGTYRVQTATTALAHLGLYSATIFNLRGMESYFPRAIELGRACLAKDHRTLHAILTLWSGLGEFMKLFDQQYLFGCCSLTTRNMDDGWRAMKTIRAKGYLDPDLRLSPLPAHSCGDPAREFAPDLGEGIPLPKLFKTYMRLGTKVISEPAIDREFGTVDFLVVLDGKKVALSQLDILK
jgi:putative hemolysin